MAQIKEEHYNREENIKNYHGGIFNSIMKATEKHPFYIWERGDTLHYLFLYKIKERCYF